MKKILTIILIISLLFSFGCVKQDTSRGMGTSKYGIAVDFEEDSPPASFPPGYEAPVELRVVNTGKMELGSGEIKARLKGVAATDLFSPDPSKMDTVNDEPLLVSELDPTYVRIDLGSITYPEEMLEAEYPADIMAEICFPYLTKVQANNFWITDKLSDLKKGSITSKDNSEAPVQVSELEESLVGDTLLFSFVVKNAGKGTVVDSCFPEEKEDEEVKIMIKQPRDIRCEEIDGSSGSVKLINGRRKINCEIEGLKSIIQNVGGHSTPLTMDLEYNYDLDVLKKVKITKRT